MKVLDSIRFSSLVACKMTLRLGYNYETPSFRSDALRALLLRNRIATLDEMKQTLGTSVDVTVFRKRKPLGYLTSYSHRGPILYASRNRSL